MLRSDMCDYSDTYIVVKGIVTVVLMKKRDEMNRQVILKIMHHLFLAFQKQMVY